MTVFGDYDVDGATSSALIKRFFHGAGVDLHLLQHGSDEMLLDVLFARHAFAGEQFVDPLFDRQNEAGRQPNREMVLRAGGGGVYIRRSG